MCCFLILTQDAHLFSPGFSLLLSQVLMLILPEQIRRDMAPYQMLFRVLQVDIGWTLFDSESSSFWPWLSHLQQWSWLLRPHLRWSVHLPRLGHHSLLLHVKKNKKMHQTKQSSSYCSANGNFGITSKQLNHFFTSSLPTYCPNMSKSRLYLAEKFPLSCRRENLSVLLRNLLISRHERNILHLHQSKLFAR